VALALPFTREAAVWVGSSVVGGLVGTPSVVRAVKSWYAELPKPSWCPPDRVFAPVWTCLYASMGYSALLAKRSAGLDSLPVRLFFAHYLLNLSWAPLFFGLKKLRAACALNFVLIGSLAAVMGSFAPLNPLSASLLVPYMAWLCFATVLNIEICRLNPVASAAVYGGSVGGGGGGGGGEATDEPYERWTPKQSLELLSNVGKEPLKRKSREDRFIEQVAATDDF